MTPKWKFKDVPGSPYKGRPFFNQQWPSDLPDNCHVCGTKFRMGFNIRHGPGKIGRILRTTAYISVLPCLIIGAILPLFFPGFYEGWGAWHSTWLYFGLMFIPPMALAGISCLMPRSRHLQCKKCGWNRDYKPLELG